MESRFTRTERVYGPDAVKKLAGSRVAVFGLGGVGGYALEALARSGIGALDLVRRWHARASGRWAWWTMML